MSEFSNQYLSIPAIHQGLNEKKFSVVELTQEYLNRVQSSELNAFITVCGDRALQQAQEQQSLLDRDGQVPRETHPLFGVPMGIKDLMTIEGVETTCASEMLRGYRPPYTSTAVTRLEGAGGITLGKLNMDEFAMGSSNENSAFGPVQHPTHPGYVPGGSSGGSSAAVGADLCTVALGTDTGGSIRLPASYCGVVGVKPTYGRVSRYGLIAFSSSLDQVGSLSKSVEDSVYFLDAVAGHDPKDSTSAPVLKPNWIQSLEASKGKMDWSSVRIGVPQEYFGDGLSEKVDQSVRDVLKWCESQGATLKEVSLPHSQYGVATYYIVAVSEASSNLARFDGVRYGARSQDVKDAKDLQEFYLNARSHFGPEVKRRIILGTFALSSGFYDAYYQQACKVRNLIKMDFEKVFEDVDFLISPVSPTPAFKIGEKIDDPLQMYLNDISTIPSSLAGLPAMSIPCGQDEKGLSIGVQIMAPQFEEEKMFALAHAIENR